MRRRRIQVEIALLHILAVIALRSGQPEEPLFQDWILPVPERYGKAETTLPIGNPEQPVLSPAVGSAASIIVWKIIPTAPVRRIIFPNSAPLPLRKIRSPPSPIFQTRGILRQTLPFNADRRLPLVDF